MRRTPALSPRCRQRHVLTGRERKANPGAKIAEKEPASTLFLPTVTVHAPSKSKNRAEA
jgi:hypothetical protein